MNYNRETLTQIDLVYKTKIGLARVLPSTLL